MNPVENKVVEAFIEVVKTVGGRGPKNVYARVKEEHIEIHFWLIKSPLEGFIYERFHDGPSYLEEMYHRIFHIIKDEALSRIYACTGLLPVYKDFVIDVERDKFCFMATYSHSKPLAEEEV